MKLLSKTPFWFTAFVCPVLMLAGIYNLGYLVGYLLNLDFSHLNTEQALRIASVVIAIIALIIFIRSFKDIKQRLFTDA